MNTLEQSIEKYQFAIKLTEVLSRRALSILRKVFFVCLVICTVGGLITLFFLDGQYSQQIFGLSFLFVMLWIEQMLLYSYHNSYYFRGLNSIIGIEEEDIEGATYDVANMIFKHKDDAALAFCISSLGSISLMRSGLAPELVDNFLKSNRVKLAANQIMLPPDEIFSIIGLGKYLLTHDPSFKEMIKNSGIKEDSFLGALRWVIGSYHQEKRRERWWSKDNLSKTTGVGREWTYGTAFLLEKYSRDIRTSAVFSTLGGDSSFANEKITEIESALSRTQSSNVLLIGEAGVGKIDLIMKVASRMKLGQSLNSITSKNIIVLDTNRLFATHKDKQGLEFTIIDMFHEAAEAGNIIIVIENLSSFVREAEAMGIFIPELIDPYLSIPNLQVIATDTPSSYHTYLETLGSFSRRFSEILIDSPDLSATTRLLQNVALVNEFKFKILFTYPALQAITVSADRFIVEGVMPDKAISLLGEVAANANSLETGIITDDFVYTYISEKVGVPAGPIQESERDLLLHLEDRLHQQVIGQKNAIDAIARTMRRARAGIQSSEKPIGSFLFLGPTGVGKTETAKALAKVFFGGKTKCKDLICLSLTGRCS
jgi:ATP-dependent Clp protease ATP-binding subunit ClpA